MKQAYKDALAIAREALHRQEPWTDEYDATLSVVAYLTFAMIDAQK